MLETYYTYTYYIHYFNRKLRGRENELQKAEFESYAIYDTVLQYFYSAKSRENGLYICEHGEEEYEHYGHIDF